MGAPRRSHPGADRCPSGCEAVPEWRQTGSGTGQPPTRQAPGEQAAEQLEGGTFRTPVDLASLSELGYRIIGEDHALEGGGD